MKRGSMLLLLSVLVGLYTALPCAAGETPFSSALMGVVRGAAVERPGLAGARAEAPPLMAMLETKDDAEETGSRSVSPVLAGLLSAVVPGAGQLVQGQNRGWFYLGAEVVSIFSAYSLRSAGNQAEEDYQQFADVHWAWQRYETASACGEGLGPIDFERERDALREVYDTMRDQYYEDIGRLNVYACGWDALDNRGEYVGMRSDANSLFSAARYAVTAAFLNHVVSAVDATKSASNRRRREESHSLRMGWGASPGGDLALRVELAGSF